MYVYVNISIFKKRDAGSVWYACVSVYVYAGIGVGVVRVCIWICQRRETHGVRGMFACVFVRMQVYIGVGVVYMHMYICGRAKGERRRGCVVRLCVYLCICGYRCKHGCIYVYGNIFIAKKRDAGCVWYVCVCVCAYAGIGVGVVYVHMCMCGRAKGERRRGCVV